MVQDLYSLLRHGDDRERHRLIGQRINQGPQSKGEGVGRRYIREGFLEEVVFRGVVAVNSDGESISG